MKLHLTLQVGLSLDVYDSYMLSVTGWLWSYCDTCYYDKWCVTWIMYWTYWI